MRGYNERRNFKKYDFWAIESRQFFIFVVKYKDLIRKNPCSIHYNLGHFKFYLISTNLVSN